VRESENTRDEERETKQWRMKIRGGAEQRWRNNAEQASALNAGVKERVQGLEGRYAYEDVPCERKQENSAMLCARTCMMARQSTCKMHSHAN